MRRQQNIFQAPQGAIFRQRLRFEDIQGRSSDLSFRERRHHRVFVDNRASLGSKTLRDTLREAATQLKIDNKLATLPKESSTELLKKERNVPANVSVAASNSPAVAGPFGPDSSGCPSAKSLPPSITTTTSGTNLEKSHVEPGSSGSARSKIAGIGSVSGRQMFFTIPLPE